MRYLTLTSYPDPDLAARWEAALETAPFATHYVTPEYFTDPYVHGRRFAVLATEVDGAVAAVLTGTVDGGRVTSGMFSRPQMVLLAGADRGEAAEALLAGIDELTGTTTSFIEIYSWREIPEFLNRGMQGRKSSDATSVVVLDLSDGADAIFARFSQTRRNEIRRAIKQRAVEVKELETEAELAELYQIHLGWNERKGNAAGTIENMRTAAAQRENRRVFIAKTSDRVIAGSFYRFCRGGVVEYAANYSMPEH